MLMLLGICVGFLFFLGLWLAVSRSPLIPDLFEWLVTKEPMTHKDVENWFTVREKWKLLRLWTCPHCQAFWMSLLQGLHCACWIAAVVGLPFWFCLFAFPVLVLSFYPLYFFTISKLWKL